MAQGSTRLPRERVPGRVPRPRAATRRWRRRNDGEDSGEGLFRDPTKVSNPMDRWRSALSSRGWVAPAWPKEYGGAGLDTKKQFILNEEIAEFGAMNVGGFGVMMLGPTLIVHGTRRAEEGAPAAASSAAASVVPGLQRAGRRLRPRLAADARGARRRRLRDQRPEDLDQRARSTRTGCTCSRGPTRMRRSTAASPSSCSI